jgi:hypothetical protein
VIDRLRTAGTVCLAGIAIAGLLSMHGLEASVTLTTTAHHHPTEQATPNHGAVGLCLIFVGLVGTGLAARGLSRRTPAPAVGAPRFTRRFVMSRTLAAPVRSRSIELCVLRV